MTLQELLRPYRAAFASRFLQMLQYRTAALAGFGTQCWWGGIKVMVLAAFYGNAAAAELPMTLAHAITYTWLAQGLLALLPWAGDPEVAQAVRSGSVAYDRLRPVDAYGLWFVRSAGWIAARVLPRLALMLAFAGVALPLLGWGEWGWQPPAGIAAAAGFGLSALMALLLSVSMVMLLNVAAAAALNERGINAIAVPLVVVLSGNLLPLALLPDGWQTALLLQPLAGLMDIPMRLYMAKFTGWQALGGIALQAFWIAVLIVLGRLAMRRTMRRLEVQGG
ncbi:ABC transporter permease [Variovorax saccharolyticus]|uniref:ABC transporter permease n=1 Tax=Variovorax saccharolyticus TaxID=3053516 RepID=UPI0025779137|nr:ABC transporter permease [Variovorax sp. J22R187]MDM0018940.1 ABC transporter permease [Variovorax sp. J22R187]